MPVPALEGRVRNALSSRYAIERQLGRGGMATVFLARDIAQDRNVAIKVLDHDGETVFAPDRFLREIRLLATLQHPNILPLYDSGLIGDTPYYVMPFVAGESLRERLNRDGKLELPLALRVNAEAAAALDYAHRQGVIHRDIKPENILLSDDHVLIADFGIARAAAQSADDRLTQTSTIIGTPAYMSPEQASGAELDGRSDVYSLACVLFEMIAGRSPFSGPTPAVILANRFKNEAPRITSFCPGVPRTVERALSAALAITPDDRPSSAGAFAAMLAGEMRLHGRSRRVPARNIMTALAALTIVAAVSLFWRYESSRIGAEETSTLASRPLARRGTANVSALDLYLRGRELQGRQDTLSWRKALALFHEAIARDSMYAAPWAGISQVYASFGIGNQAAVQPRPAFEQARMAAQRALELDSTSVEAYAAMSLVQMMYEYDWDGALVSLDKAYQLDPGYERIYLYRGFLLSWLGKFDEATAATSEGLRMDPSASALRRDINRTLLLAGKTVEAERRGRETLELDSTVTRARVLLGQALLVEGKASAARLELERAQKEEPSTRAAAFLAAAYVGEGRERDARRLVDSLLTMSNRSFVPAMDLAIAYAGLHDKASTLEWLERAYDDRTLRPYIRDQVFTFVRREPRFRLLISKMNLPAVNCC